MRYGDAVRHTDDGTVGEVVGVFDDGTGEFIVRYVDDDGLHDRETNAATWELILP